MISLLGVSLSQQVYHAPSPWSSTSEGSIYIQYWLIRYNKTCPDGWGEFKYTGTTTIHCYRNSEGLATPVPNQPISNLANLILIGKVAPDGGDSVFISTGTGTTLLAKTGGDYVKAAAGWNTAEFGVFGYYANTDGGSEAKFNTGAKVGIRTRIEYGGNDAPLCVAKGFTAEKNNLSFEPTAPMASPLGPALLFTMSSSSSSLASCGFATLVGDPHLTTFSGLLYDFQASGDFVVAQRDPDFVVQARHVSGAPTWPNASVSNAVATRMGKTKVAICLGNTPLNIDGKITDLGDGEALSLPDGVDISRRGNVYFIIGQNGDSVRATVHASWIDALVGLGIWPTKVSGLLANANGDVNEIAASDGTVLTNPFPFEDLYHHYADSWRVPETESLLSVCGEERERSIPQKPFYANDLDPEVYARTRAVCILAGVKEGALLDACTLDVAVIGDDTAAQAFVGTPTPQAVGSITARKGVCQICESIYDKLVDINSTGSIVQELADSFEVSPDGKQIEFSLREGVLFHDGTSLTSDVVKFNFENDLEIFPGIVRPALIRTGAITAVEAVNDRIIKITLAQPASQLLQTLSGIAGMLASPTALPGSSVGAGPFELVSRDPEVAVVLQAFSNYWRGQPPVQQLVLDHGEGA